MKVLDLRIGEYFLVEDNLSSGDKVVKYYECVMYDDSSRCRHCSLGLTSPICPRLECEGHRRKDNISVIFVERDNVGEIAHRYMSKLLFGFKLYNGKKIKQYERNRSPCR
jgi:hypothetical protein